MAGIALVGPGLGDQERPRPLADHGLYDPLSHAARSCPCHTFRKAVALQHGTAFSNPYLLGAVLLTFALGIGHYINPGPEQDLQDRTLVASGSDPDRGTVFRGLLCS